jgi:hypothetical protein
MRERVLELLVCWRKRGFALDLGVRIAHGYATIGAIGFEERWDHGASGTVTIWSRDSAARRRRARS